MKKLISSLLAGCMITLSLSSVYAAAGDPTTITITSASYDKTTQKVKVKAAIENPSQDQIITVMSVGTSGETAPETIESDAIVHIDQIDDTSDIITDNELSLEFALKDGIADENGAVDQTKNYFVRIGGSGVETPGVLDIIFDSSTEETVAVSGKAEAGITKISFQKDTDTPIEVTPNTDGTFTANLVKGATYKVTVTAEGYDVTTPTDSAITKATDGTMSITVGDTAITNANLSATKQQGGDDDKDEITVSGTVDTGITKISFQKGTDTPIEVTPADGSFSTKLTKGEYIVTVTAEGYTVTAPENSAFKASDNGTFKITVGDTAVTNAVLKATAVLPEPKILYGDVNGDKTVDVGDAALLLQYVLNPASVKITVNTGETADESSLKTGQVHLKRASVRDGENQTNITAEDVSLILQKIMGNGNFKFPAEK